jgi:hypothetical protein
MAWPTKIVQMRITRARECPFAPFRLRHGDTHTDSDYANRYAHAHETHVVTLVPEQKIIC